MATHCTDFFILDFKMKYIAIDAAGIASRNPCQLTWVAAITATSAHIFLLLSTLRQNKQWPKAETHSNGWQLANGLSNYEDNWFG